MSAAPWRLEADRARWGASPPALSLGLLGVRGALAGVWRGLPLTESQQATARLIDFLSAEGIACRRKPSLLVVDGFSVAALASRLSGSGYAADRGLG